MAIIKCSCRQTSDGNTAMADMYDRELGPGLRIANPVKRWDGQPQAARCVLCTKISPVVADHAPDNF